MSLRSWLVWIGFAVLMGALFVGAYYSLTLGEDWAARLFPEDHFFENLGAASLFLAGVLSLLAFARARRQGHGRLHPARPVLYLLMALAFLFACGEEVGWGQRLLHPAAQASAQAVTNPGSPSLPQANEIFLAALTVLGVGLPAALLLFPAIRKTAGRILPLPLLGTLPLFFLNQLMAGWARDSYRPWYRFKLIRFPQAIQEIKETNFELLCLCLAVIALIELGRAVRSAAPPGE